MRTHDKIFGFLFAMVAIFFVSNFFNGNIVLASPSIISSSLNGQNQNVTFNPNNSEVSIEVRSSIPVKFTRLYICSISQECTGSKGEYTRYFTSSEISESITKVWNGRVSSDNKSDFAPAGEYKIMASMVEGTNTAVTEFSPYTITIDFSDDDSNTATTTSDTDDTTTATSTTNNTNTTSVSNTTSTHYEEESLSTYTAPVTSFSVSAGRERISYVGTPIYFEAKYKVTGEIKSKKPNFKWSMGDGAYLNKEEVVHYYKYPGEYNVVLNASLNDLDSISRTKVKVLTPNISMLNKADGVIEIFNKGSNEINLYGFKLQSGDTTYSFPVDTIISAGKSVVFPAEYLHLALADKVSLLDASNKAVLDVNNIFAMNNTNEISKIELEKFVLEYKRLTAVTKVKPVQAPTPLAVATTSKIAIEKSPTEIVKVENNISQTASVAEIVINNGQTDGLKTPRGFWSKVFNPVRTVREAFYQ
jgi:hypothetical protein